MIVPRIAAVIFLLLAGQLIGSAASAQMQRKPAVVAVFIGAPVLRSDFRLRAIEKGMKEFDYVEGRDYQLELRSGEAPKHAELAAEIVDLKPDVVIAMSTATAQAVQKVTTEIPVVFLNVTDPVGAGLARSLARPGGNFTGRAQTGATVDPKRLQLLAEAVPGLCCVAILTNLSNTSLIQPSVDERAKALHIAIDRLDAHTSGDLDKILSAASDRRFRAVLVEGDTLLGTHRPEIVAWAKRERLALAGWYREDALAGYLLSYGVKTTEEYRLVTAYVDKILKGASPANLPIEVSTKYGLTINLRTARELKIELPSALLAQADELIE